MSIYVIYGTAIFATTQKRNQVFNRGQTAATQYGFTPSPRVPGLPPGIVKFDYTVPPLGEGEEPDPDMPVVGALFPALTICYEHTNKALIDQAQLVINNEIQSQGWLRGDFGTWTAVL